MMVPVTGLYAALLAGIVVYLSFRAESFNRAIHLVTRFRPAVTGDIPLFLLLLLISELNGVPALLLHVMGMTFAAGRVVHGVSMLGNLGRWSPEAIGPILLGWVVLCVMAGINLVLFLRHALGG